MRVDTFKPWPLLKWVTGGPRGIKQILKDQERELHRVNGYDSRIPEIILHEILAIRA